MGIDVGSAYARARELRGLASQLRGAKNSMTLYKGIFGTSWQGTEVPYYISAIGSTEVRLLQAASELESIAGSIEAAADQIRREEIEEERKRYLAWLEEQERIRQQEEAAAAAVAATTSRGRKK